MRWSLLLFCLIAAPALAATGSMIRADDLREAPSSGAEVVGHVAKGASVEVLGRQSGWTQVKSGGKIGWVRILSVRTNTADGGADLGGLIEAGSTRRDPNRAVAVAGVRGLSEEELKGAKYNAQEIALTDLFKVDKATAEQFASAGGLVTRQVAQLPAPQAESAKPKAKGNKTQPDWSTGEGL